MFQLNLATALVVLSGNLRISFLQPTKPNRYGRWSCWFLPKRNRLFPKLPFFRGYVSFREGQYQGPNLSEYVDSQFSFENIHSPFLRQRNWEIAGGGQAQRVPKPHGWLNLQGAIGWTYLEKPPMSWMRNQSWWTKNKQDFGDIFIYNMLN